MYIVPSKIWLIYVCFLKRWNKYLTTNNNKSRNIGTILRSIIFQSATLRENLNPAYATAIIRYTLDIKCGVLWLKLSHKLLICTLNRRYVKYVTKKFKNTFHKEKYLSELTSSKIIPSLHEWLKLLNTNIG